MENKVSDMTYLFEPRAVAIIGASNNQDKIGYKIIENITYNQYPGKIYPVNPKGGEILGLPVYKTLNDIADHIDLACIAIPAKYTFAAVKDCALRGVKFLVIMTSGFAEIGNAEEERKIVTYANEHGMRVLGPNIFGIYSSMASLNATFGPKEVKPGNVAIITQSGALGIAMFGKTKAENIGLSAVVSVGNKADLDEADLLGYLLANEETKVILMYIEGIRDGEKLIAVLKETTKKKPVVVIKSGKSKKGAIAAASHTGSLAGADEIFSDIMKQCGVIRAESIQEALIWCKVLSNSPVPKGENTVIITNGGGFGVMAADACEKYNVNLYDDIQTTNKVFSKAVPEFGSAKNPIDITGQATINDYELALNAALRNDAIDAIICLGCGTAVLDTEKLPLTIAKFFSQSQAVKPVVFSFLGGTEIEDSIHQLRMKGIPIFSDVYEAVSCLGAIYSHYRNLKYKSEVTALVEEIEIDTRAIEAIIQKVRSDKRQFLLTQEARGVMAAAGIRMPKSYIARNIAESVTYAEEIGYPVVMKVVSKDIIHKSDVGGVALDLENKDEVTDAYQAIIHSCRLHSPNAIIEGIEVSEMIPAGTEVILGTRRDRGFGPIVMFGLGGIYVEVMKDVSFRALPLNSTEAIAMIKEIRSYPLLLGVRGEGKKDINSVVDTLIRLGAILQRCDSISDIEINPLIVYEEGEGSRPVDARILLANIDEVK
ncbi:acetate--CoA ligase family protein [Candidatus Poribacteria bacterium]|nr:acetate--CoA ligase family protein [Candidatus Poribacteria bacterium]